MSNEKLGQEPAFPPSKEMQETIGNGWHLGMSKRFYAACAAMTGLITLTSKTDRISEQIASDLAEEAYILADELLKQENK
jgi:hypothetical protein